MLPSIFHSKALVLLLFVSAASGTLGYVTLTPRCRQKQYGLGGTRASSTAELQSFATKINSILDEEFPVMRRREMLTAVAFLSSSVGLQSADAFDSEEARRIAIFEKTSPSVVFIDTFAERRDSLTTNVFEVPLGSGSGFVWVRSQYAQCEEIGPLIAIVSIGYQLISRSLLHVGQAGSHCHQLSRCEKFERSPSSCLALGR